VVDLPARSFDLAHPSVALPLLVADVANDAASYAATIAA